jgi:hypothetical protein
MRSATNPATAIILFILLVLSSCIKDEVKSKDAVVSESFDSVLNFVITGFGVEKMVLVHTEEYFSKLPTMSVQRVLNENFIKDPGEREVVQGLIKSIRDSIKMKFDSYNFGDKVFIKTINHLDIEPEDRKYYDDPAYFGSINMSRSFSDENFGCYYFALNCGKKCSAGFLITATRISSRWKVKEIIQIWGA